jgi:hypothetical protein
MMEPGSQTCMKNEGKPSETDIRFTYHPPKPEQIPKYNAIGEAAKAFVEGPLAYCPESREKSLALTHLEDAVFWANAAIARRS